MKFKDTKYGDLTGQTHNGDINVSDLELTSLEGAPKVVHGKFDCSFNKLTTLEGGPEETTDTYVCDGNKLVTLIGAPKTVGGIFSCEDNGLISLEGGPSSVRGYFSCDDNNLTSLRGAPKFGTPNFFGIGNPNPHLEQEWDLRRKEPNLSEKEIFEKMCELTGSEFYLSEEIRRTFLF